MPRPAAVSIRLEGVIASGARVIADGVRAGEVASLHRKVHVIEMESVGVAVAAELAKRPMGFLVVKCVSDLADAAKSDGWHASAARLSAEFARDVIVAL